MLDDQHCSTAPRRDAPISPGNSGGALLNAAGQVIGSNVAFIPPEARAVSIGFAIPAPTVVDDVRQLVDNGKAVHAFLGVRAAEVTPEIAQQFDLSVESGGSCRVSWRARPQRKAGVRAGEVIVAFGGTMVSTVKDLFAALRQHKPGDKVTLKVVRRGKEVELDVTLSGRAVG